MACAHFFCHKLDKWFVIRLHIRLTRSLSFPSALFSPFFHWCRPLFFRAAMFFAIIRETNETQERKKASGLVSSHHHHHSLYPPSHSPSLLFSVLHLSVFLSDSWQPVGYSGHANPSADICQLTWENTHLNVTDSCVLQLCVSYCCSFLDSSNTMQHTLHCLLPTELCGHFNVQQYVHRGPVNESGGTDSRQRPHRP